MRQRGGGSPLVDPRKAKEQPIAQLGAEDQKGFWGPVVAAVIPFVADALFGGPSSAEQALTGAGVSQAQAEAEATRQRTDLLNDLENQIREMAKGGRPPIFDLDLRNPQSQEDFFGQIAPMGEINQLMRLLGVPTSTGAASSAAALGLSQRNRREDGLAQLAQALLIGLGDFGGSGGGNNNSTGQLGAGVGDAIFDEFGG